MQLPQQQQQGDDRDAAALTQDTHYTFWGLRAEVQASTVYQVASMADAMEPSLEQSGKNTIEVIYENCVCLPIDARVDVMEEGEVWGGGGSGRKEAPSGHVNFCCFPRAN